MLKCKVKKNFFELEFFLNTFFQLEKYLESKFSLFPKVFTVGDFPSPVKTIALKCVSAGCGPGDGYWSTSDPVFTVVETITFIAHTRLQEVNRMGDNDDKQLNQQPE